VAVVDAARHHVHHVREAAAAVATWSPAPTVATCALLNTGSVQPVGLRCKSLAQVELVEVLPLPTLEEVKVVPVQDLR